MTQCVPVALPSYPSTPLQISHRTRYGVGWYEVVCYGAPEWFRQTLIQQARKYRTGKLSYSEGRYDYQPENLL